MSEGDTVPVTIATASWFAYRPDMGLAIRASLGMPKKGFAHPLEELRVATPHPSYFRASDEEFERRFLEQLNRAGVVTIRRKLQEFADSHGATTVVLLCFERDRADCHRGMFAQWWEDQTGERIEELGYRPTAPPKDPKPKKTDEPKLF